MINTVAQELQKAINTEAEGYRFYLAAANYIEDKKGKDIFRYLAKHELDHMKALTYISLAIREEGNWVDYERAIQLSASISEKEMVPLFPDSVLIPKLLGKEATLVDALKFAMKIEEEAIEYYSKTLEGSKDKGEISFFTTIRNIEKTHLAILKGEYDSVTKAR